MIFLILTRCQPYRFDILESLSILSNSNILAITTTSNTQKKNSPRLFRRTLQQMEKSKNFTKTAERKFYFQTESKGKHCQMDMWLCILQTKILSRLCRTELLFITLPRQTRRKRRYRAKVRTFICLQTSKLRSTTQTGARKSSIHFAD